MKYAKYLVRYLVLLLLLAVVSCGITRKYKRPDDLQKDGLYRGANKNADTATIADIPWQQLFPDTVLQRLVQTGIDRNLDLKIAIARMETAVANLRQSKAAFLPTFSVSANVTETKSSVAQLRAFNINSSQNTVPYTQYSLLGTVSWEADVWGKLRSVRRSYVAAYLQSEAYKRAVQTQLIADIANDYYALLAYDEQRRILEQTIVNRKKDVEAVAELKKYGVVTGADLVQSEANLHAAEVALPDTRQSCRELENALSVLLSMPPDSIPRTNFYIQVIDTSLRTGVSAQLLANRPDVQQAELGFRSAFELTNVARTYFYPALTISSGTGGWATANTLQGFFDGTFYGTIVGSLTQPIFNRGLNKQRLRAAQAAQAEAYYTFQRTVLTAGQEVSNALFAYSMGIEKSSARKLQIQSLEKASEFTKELLKYTSNTNYTDVLTAEQNLLSAQLNSVSDRLQQLQAVVNLYRALGGGWK